MNWKTAKMASEWVDSYNGDIEKTARWMRDTLRIGGMKENRRLLAEALAMMGRKTGGYNEHSAENQHG